MAEIKTKVELPHSIEEALISAIFDITKEAQNSLKQADLPTYLTKRETCKYLGISNHTLSEWIEKGLVKYKRIGKIYRFNRFELDKFMASK